MSKVDRQIADKLRNLLRQDVTLDGEVVSVDETELTCAIVTAEGLELSDVMLKALRGKSDCFVVIPKLGTDVQIVNTGGAWMVVSCDVAEKVMIKIGATDVLVMEGEVHAKVGDTVHKMTSSSHTIKTSDEDLKEILIDLIDEINKITVTTSSGPSGIPINKAAFEAIKGRIPKLLS